MIDSGEGRHASIQSQAQVNQGTRLKISLVTGAGRQPAWLVSLAGLLERSDRIDLRWLCISSENRALYERRTGLFEAWKRLDAKVFAGKIADADYSEELVEPSPVSAFDSREPSDVVVWMVPGRPPTEACAASRFGVWTIANAFDSAYGFSEVANREPVTRCDIMRHGELLEDDEVIASAYAATDKLSLARGLGGVRAKCNALLLSTIERVAVTGQVGDGLTVDEVPSTAEQSVPGFGRLLLGLGRLYGTYLFGLPRRLFYFDQWQLAYRSGGNRLDRAGLQRLMPAHSGFWADPFVAEREGRRFIFFEEYLQETRRGHIAAMEVDEQNAVGKSVDVLKTEFHLSYPFLFEHGEDLFMVPECADSGRVEAYRCVRYPDRWEPHAVLLDNVSAYDPTLVEHGGKWWMFLTIQHDGNSPHDELHLFYSRTPFGSWSSHPLNPICLDVRLARPAGALFSENGRLYRPAQDCSRRYGYAISLQEIVRMTTEDYEEVRVDHITPDWAGNAHATHTMNQSCGITLYDFEVNRRKA